MAEARDYKILAFGDSLTAGYTLPANDSYPAQLERLLNKEGYKVKIVNAGVSGETTEQGLRRIDWVLKQSKYDIVLLCLGANDGLRQLPITQMTDNLIKIIEKFQASGSKVYLLGMKMPLNMIGAYRDNFDKAFEKIAKQKKIPFYPFLLEGVAANPQLNIADQIHPNAQGYEIISKNLTKFIKSHLN